MKLPGGEEVEVVARMENGWPWLTREERGDGVVYRLATLPLSSASNLAAGYVWVPMIQRMLREGRRMGRTSGTWELGDWRPMEGEDWEPIQGGGNPLLNVGRYRDGSKEVAVNRPVAEDGRDRLTLAEIEAWAAPLTLRMFEAAPEDTDAGPSRLEFTSFLALLALVFLVLESWLLTRNIRRPMQTARSTWRPVS
jgi:hypothetical protein